MNALALLREHEPVLKKRSGVKGLLHQNISV